ncbi:Nuclear control of ATPase protein 2 [Paecilomyces lecythidis]|uniref:Nuclear control of ATPase protein 2 n=1 Tax=Paecilomyces lecythidis TaxID=3004212 RepID=A0ABR3WQM7_9EURO
MSVVIDNIRRLDAQIDRFQLRDSEKVQQHNGQQDSYEDYQASETIYLTKDTADLTAIVRTLSVTSSSKPLLQQHRLIDILSQVQQVGPNINVSAEVPENYAADLLWLVAAKAAVQTLGIVMDTFLTRTLSLNDGIWYWDEVLGSYWSTGLYTIQTSPWRLYSRATEIYSTFKRHYGDQEAMSTLTISGRWGKFHDLVRRSIREQSIERAKSRMLSPFAVCRSEARRKRRSLKMMREMHASAVGLLMDECLSFGLEEEAINTGIYSSSSDEWHNTVSKSVLLMEALLRNATNLDIGLNEFEDGVFSTIESETDALQSHGVDSKSDSRALLVIERLINILKERLPGHEFSSNTLVGDHGRPSRLVRYWLPVSAGLCSLSTVLSILTSHKADLLSWIAEFGSTIVDFGRNWVIEPIGKLIGTIRHDEKSEIAIMSRNSLEADRASLERMVVDFVLDNPEPAREASRFELDAGSITAKVREGDLTPVLKAYEQDLRQPFRGTVRGNLVRALLIQIQKTKVDVEIAIGGIDALLKSQELVFGFVGLTPGILASYAVFRWLNGLFGSRKGLRRGKKQDEMRRALRNADRVLTSASPTPNGILSYKDHGLLICEAQVLKKAAKKFFPGPVYHDFEEDMSDLMNINAGVEKQLRIVERIRWGYSKWLG